MDVPLLGLLNYKTLLVLLLAVVLNIGVFVLLWQLDVFVHVELYTYGLIFSYEWAEIIWHNNLVCWTFIIGATALAVAAAAPHYMLSKEAEPKRSSKLASFILSVAALVFEGTSIYYLNQIDFTVRNSLHNFGIPHGFDWTITLEPLMSAAYALTVISFLALMISAIRSLGIIEIEIVDETE